MTTSCCYVKIMDAVINGAIVLAKSKNLPELTKVHQVNTQNRANIHEQSTLMSSSNISKTSGINHCIYTDTCNYISIIQQEFTLSGTCKIAASHQAVLIATIGERVVSTHILSAVESGSNQFDTPSDEVCVNFSMPLDFTLLNEYVHLSIKFTLFNKTQRVLIDLPVSDLLVNALGSDFKVESIAPSYGFFGGGKSEPLIVEVGGNIRSLTLSLDQQKSFLNLRGLTFFDADNNPIPADGMSVSCSSTNQPDPHSTKLLHGQGFHSKREDCPWITVTFETLSFVKRVEVSNRRDKLGSRAQKLRISVVDEFHAKFAAYSPFSQLSIAEFLIKIFEMGAYTALFTKDILTRREAILDCVLASLTSKPQNKETVFFALNFISTWATELPIQYLHNKELKILATYIFEATKGRLGFSLMPFSRLLPYTNNLEFLELELNRLRDKNSLANIMFTKHGLSKQGMLVQNILDVLKTLDTVMNDFAEMGLRPCLAYGTLLGAYREKQFIAHDDDVDILVEFADEGLTREKAYALRTKLIEQLDLKKYRVSSGSKVPTNLNIHLYLKETNIMIDVFPYWHDGENAILHMEKMAIRAIPRTILAGRTEIELAGKTFMAPGETEAFLVERYGETWNVSDKYHEWTWPIKTQQTDNEA
jgi:hypothetical protein